MTTLEEDANANNMDLAEANSPEADAPEADTPEADSPDLGEDEASPDAAAEEILYALAADGAWHGPFTATQLIDQVDADELDLDRYARIVGGPAPLGTERRVLDIVMEAAQAASSEVEPDPEGGDIEALNFATSDSTALLLQASDGLTTLSKGLKASGNTSAAANTSKAAGALGALGAAFAIYSLAESIFDPKESEAQILSRQLRELAQQVDQLQERMEENFRRIRERLDGLAEIGQQTLSAIDLSMKRTTLLFTADAVRVHAGAIGAAARILDKFREDLALATPKGDAAIAATLNTGYWVNRLRRVSAAEMYTAAYQLSALCKRTTTDPIEMNLFQSYYDVTWGHRDLILGAGVQILSAIGAAGIIDTYLAADGRSVAEADARKWSTAAASLYEPLLANVRSSIECWVKKAEDEVMANIERRISTLLTAADWSTSSTDPQAIASKVYNMLSAEFSWLSYVVAVHGPVTTGKVADTTYTASRRLSINGPSPHSGYRLVIAWEDRQTIGDRTFDAAAAGKYATTKILPPGHTLWKFNDAAVAAYCYNSGRTRVSTESKMVWSGLGRSRMKEEKTTYVVMRL